MYDHVPTHRRVYVGRSILQDRKQGHYPQELRAQVQELYAHCRDYAHARDGRAIWQLVSTAIPFFALLGLMVWLVPHSAFAMVLALPAGGLLTRFFALQHDCGHGSFFSSKRANEIVGQVISLFTFTPYHHWRVSHAMHHSTSGNLDRRGIGDIETLTVAEFKALTQLERLRYRIMRHPLVALVIGPPVYFLILQRLAIGSNLSKREFMPGLMIHNLALLLFYAALIYLLGPWLVAKTILPTVLVAAWIGGWLFFVQHQFEETLWDGADAWDVKIAALRGSSHLMLPAVLNWFSCDIGLHHIHHLSSRIPNYRLRECLAAHKGLQDIAPKLSLWCALKSMRLALWDETSRRLISFREFRLVHT